MAVLTTILSPDPKALQGYRERIEAIAPRLLPPPLQTEKWIRVFGQQQILVAVLGRREHVTFNEGNVLSGVIVSQGQGDPWWTMGASAPDGSFALLRANDSAIEAVTDYTGSKSIWYARLGCGGVVASTCVELILAVLGDFRVDEEALGWFLSSGTCGPRRSWDRRIRPVLPNSRLHARRDGSAISLSEVPLAPQPLQRERVSVAGLERTLTTTLSRSGFGDEPWALALSGGYDSRALLGLTRHLEDLTCVTWVDEHLTEEADSDLAIARRLARTTHRKHVIKVIHRPRNDAEMESALRRFVLYSDGRVDNYLAYVDGMQMWDELGVSLGGGLLRGDEVFGSAIATNTAQVLQNMRLISFRDYAAGPQQKVLAGRFGHSVPEDLLQQPGENARRWRWRLRAAYEISTVYAALNAIRSRFIEVACPLLTGELVGFAQSMSVRNLDDKALFSKVVGRMFPGIPFAARSSILRRADVHAIPQTNALVLEHLNSAFAREVLGVQCCRAIREELISLQCDMPEHDARHGIASRKKSSAPKWAKNIKRRFDSPPELHLPTLGMRSYLANLVQEELARSATSAAGRAPE